MDHAERLDAALERAGSAPVDLETVRLVDLAAEVAVSLQSGWLTAEDRDRLYARALELAVRRSPWTVARRFVVEHPVSTIAGGAAVTIAAGAAITVALTRHREAAPAAA